MNCSRCLLLSRLSLNRQVQRRGLSALPQKADYAQENRVRPINVQKEIASKAKQEEAADVHIALQHPRSSKLPYSRIHLSTQLLKETMQPVQPWKAKIAVPLGTLMGYYSKASSAIRAADFLYARCESLSEKREHFFYQRILFLLFTMGQRHSRNIQNAGWNARCAIGLRWWISTCGWSYSG